MWIKRLLLFCLILGQAGLVHAQGQLVSGQAIVNTTTSVSGIPGNTVLQAVPNASITVCSALGGGIPCAPLVTIYANSTLSVIAPNPLTTDANGNFAFYVPPLSAGYIYSQTGSGIVGQLFPIAGSISSGGGSTTPGIPGGSFQFNSGGVFAGAAGVTTPDNGNSVDIKGPIPWIDATKYGMRTLGVFNTITVTTNGTTSVLTAGVGDFINNDGIAIPGAGAATSQSTPSAPTTTVLGATGAQTVNYKCVGIDAKNGFTAASSAGSATTVPTVFGNPATVINAISRVGTTVTGTTATNMPFSSGTFHAVVANVTGGVEQFSGLQLITATGATSFTYTQSSQTESGTTSAGSYVLPKNGCIVTQAQATAGSNQVVLTCDTNHNIPFVSSGTRPTRIYTDGINFSAAPVPGYANGIFGVTAATANTLTITTSYISPITTTATASAANATSQVAQMTVTTWAAVDVTCPALSGTTQYYAVYGDYGSGYSLVNFTPWGTNILEDYGPAFTQTGLVVPPAMALPTTPPTSAQAQTYVGQITNIVGSTLTVTPSVPGSVTNVTAQHDSGIPLLNALAASCANSQFYPVYIPAATGAFGYYLFSAPVTLTDSGCNRATILDGGPIFLNGTLHPGTGMGILEWFRPRNLSGWSNTAQGANSGGQTYIFGRAPTMMVMDSAGAKIDGMQFNTLSNGEVSLMLYGGSGGNINNPEITNSTFQTAGGNNLSSIPLYIYDVSFGLQFHNVTFTGDKNWMYPIADTFANSELGDPSYWPIPSIEITGAFVPRVKMDGINYGLYRGIQFDALYPNTHTAADVDISDVNTFQAPQQGLLNVYGSSAGLDGLKLTRVVMDSIANPVVTCTVSGTICQNGVFVNEWSNNNGAGNLMSGPPWGATFDILVNGGHPTTNVNECSFVSSAALNCTTPFSAASFSAGATPPLAVCSTASGAICFGSGTVPCVPTAGQACIQYDKITDRFLYTLDGSPLAALVGSSGAPIDLTAQSSAIPATNINNSVPSTAVYRLCFSAAITTIGSVSSTLGGANGFQVIYTSPTDSVVKTTVPNAAWSSAANTTSTAVGGCQEVYAKAATPLQYSFGYTSNAGGTMVYELHIREEDGN